MTDLVPELITDERPVTRERIMDLQAYLQDMPQAPPHTRHFFAEGLYGRELFVPAGVCAVGKIHKHAQITIIMGDVTVVSTGEPPQRVSGYEVLSTPPDIKRAVYAHTDTFITTFHANPADLHDLEELEAYLIAPSFDALEASKTEKLEVTP